MKLKRQIMAFIVLVLGIILITLMIPRTHDTLVPTEIRAALDIGSGATNLIVAKVDPKTDKIITQIFEKSIAVPYQKELEKSTDNTFNQEVMDQGVKAIVALKELATSYHAKKVVAVATAAFRQASNAEAFAKDIELKTGVQVRIINQDQEGILAFRGALATTSIKPEDALVWDIGGGSMQLTSLSKEGTYLVEKGKLASVPFKNYVIEKIQHKDLQQVASPNPMTAEQMQEAVNYAATMAKETNPAVVEKLHQPGLTILAVGNLFNYGVKPVAGDAVIKQAVLEKNTMALVGQTDAQLDKGALSEVAVTNPLLVLGYMKGLDIQSVEAVNVNNANGVLTYPPYWE